MALSVVNVARCKTHGLHGEREECFECGEAVEQVAMIPESEVAPLVELAEAVAASDFLAVDWEAWTARMQVRAKRALEGKPPPAPVRQARPGWRDDG
jgi:hypothetical protein